MWNHWQSIVYLCVKALQAQALQLMALGVAGAQTVVPVSGSPVLLTMPSASQCGNIKPTIPAAMPTAQIQPTATVQIPVSTSAPLILPKITTSLATPTPTSVVSTPPSQDSVNKQQLMEQLANSVTKSGTNGQQDSDINEELVEFMKYDSRLCYQSSFLYNNHRHCYCRYHCLCHCRSFSLLHRPRNRRRSPSSSPLRSRTDTSR